MSSGRGRLSAWLAAFGAALVLAGLAAWFLQSPTTDAPGATGSPASRAPDPAPPVDEVVPGPTVEPDRAKWEAGAPREVRVPALGIAAAVHPIRTIGNALVPPSDPQELGWWVDGAKPGAKRGSALVTGHSVHTGGGALDDLETVQPGDTVTVRTDRGRVVYDVDRVRVFSKGAVAAHAEQLFSQSVPGRLVLITCEDWNGEVYLSNVVVTASPR